MARSIIVPVVTASLLLFASACDSKEDPYKVPEKKKRVDLHKIDNTMTKEELIEARKEAGIKSPEEIMAENAAWYETESRKYVKQRLPEYRKLIAEMRGYLDQIEKQAPKWKNEAAFTKFNDKHKAKVAEYWTKYDEVTGKGAEGGNTQAEFGKAAQLFEQLNADIGPGVADNEAFPGALKEIRDSLDKVVAALDDIEKDDSLDVADTEGEPNKGADKAKSNQ